MECKMSLTDKDEIDLDMDHLFPNGRYNSVRVSAHCRNKRQLCVTFAIVTHDGTKDDVCIEIDDSQFVTVAIGGQHGFRRRFCVDGSFPHCPDPPDPPEPPEPKLDTNIPGKQNPRSVGMTGFDDGVKDEIISVAMQTVASLRSQLEIEVRVAAENDRLLREQIANQHDELDRLRELEKQKRDVNDSWMQRELARLQQLEKDYHCAVMVFGNWQRDPLNYVKKSATRQMIDQAERSAAIQDDRRIRIENKALVSAVEQLGQQRKNERCSRIYYSELVQATRQALVESCPHTRGVIMDNIPAVIRVLGKVIDDVGQTALVVDGLKEIGFELDRNQQ